MFYIAESIKQYVNFGFLQSMSRQCATVQRDLLPSSDESLMIIGTAHGKQGSGFNPQGKKVIFYFTTGCQWLPQSTRQWDSIQSQVYQYLFTSSTNIGC